MKVESIHAAHRLVLAAEKCMGFGGRIEGLARTQLDASFGVAPIENAARRAVGAALALHKAVSDAARPGLAATTVIHTERATVGQAGTALVIDGQRDRAEARRFSDARDGGHLRGPGAPRARALP